MRWNLEDDTLILNVRSQASGEREIVWPSALVLDLDGGRVLQADEWRNRISTYTTEGEYLGSWGTPGAAPGQLDGPSGMRFDPDGNLVIAESRNNRIQRFDREGRHLETWGEAGSAPGQLDMPYGIHVDDDGSVYVADWGNDRVQKFSSDGELLAIFGASPTGVGSLTRPSGVTVDPDGDVYVADCGNNRVRSIVPAASILPVSTGTHVRFPGLPSNTWTSTPTWPRPECAPTPPRSGVSLGPPP